MTRGLRNNNPGNIRKGGDTFQGEKLPSSDPAFKQFTTMPYGYRAMFVTLATYIGKGFNTIEKIISRWAPSNENNTDGYIKNVARMSKVTKTKVLTTSDGQLIKAIVAAMSYVENGLPAVMADVESGYKLQTRITG